MTTASDALTILWESMVDRYDFLRGLIVTSADGTTLRTLSNSAMPVLPGPMIAAVCSEASKMRLGPVSSTTVYFDELTLLFSSLIEKKILLAFVLSKDANIALVQAIIPEFSALLDLRIERWTVLFFLLGYLIL